MAMDFNWFQLSPIPSNAIQGHYNYGLVALSYIIAVLASYVALDLAGRLRVESAFKARLFWLLGGAFAMGAGIWSMHFVGMLAFIMPHPMEYGLFWTIGSLLIAILASAFALFLLAKKERGAIALALGGIVLGLAIVTMHYTGMEGMTGHVQIRYLPGLFFVSILIAIVASEAAIWLILKSNQGSFKRQLPLKFVSALVMGIAICGMHYTGMAAAIFTPLKHDLTTMTGIDPYMLAFYVTATTGIIIAVALVASTYKQLMVSAVQNEKEFLNAMLDNLEDGIIAYDAKGNITLVNRTLQKKLNMPLTKKNFQEIGEYFKLRDPKNDLVIEKEQLPIFELLKTDKIHGREFVMILSNGERRDIIIDGQRIINIEGKELGALIVIHDITDRKNIEKMKNEFVSVVSHELRTPLTSIKGSLGLLLSGTVGDFTDKSKKLLEIASNNCERLLILINDILDIEKIEAGKMNFELKMVHLANLIQEAISSNVMYAEKFNVKIKLIDKVSDIQVNVDPDRLMQVLTNLISNAVKFSPNGGVVNISMKKMNEDIRVSIADEGTGIPEEFQSKIFQKFSQADASDTRNKGGTGLGLSITKAIIEKLRGKLNFSSKLKKNTKLKFFKQT